MLMRIAYIYPDRIQSDPNLTPARFEPLGLLYIVGAAEKEGYDDYKVFIPEADSNMLKFINRVKEFNPTVLAFSIMTYQVPTAIKILKEVRKGTPQKVWGIAGGPHPTIEPEYLLKRGFDICVQGEGERTFIEILKNIEERKQYDEISGITFINRKDEVVQNKKNERLNPDDIPYPKRLPNLLKGENYKGMGYPAPNIHAWASIIATRGCPYNCSFCNASYMWGNKVKYRSVKNVVKEMTYLNQEYNVDFFHFSDLNFGLNRKYTSELCDEIISSDLKVNWICMGNLQNFKDPKLIKKMGISGCSLISVGVESMNKAIIEKHVKKGLNKEQLKWTLNMISNIGIPINIFYMIGFPCQTEQSICHEIHQLKKIKAHRIRTTIFTPLPGTDIFKKISKENLSKNYSFYDTNHLVYRHPFLSSNKIKDLQKKLQKEFYLNLLYKKNISTFINKHPKYRDTFVNFWNTLGYNNELLKFLGYFGDLNSHKKEAEYAQR